MAQIHVIKSSGVAIAVTPSGGATVSEAGVVTLAVSGTANEITSTVTGGAPALSLPASLTFTGKTITGGTFASPTLTTPALGTPSSGTATNITGLPIVAGTTGTLSVARGGTGETTLPFVRAWKTSTQTVNNGATDLITFVEVTDTDNCFASSTFTAPRAGNLHVTYNFYSASAAVAQAYVYVYKNAELWTIAQVTAPSGTAPRFPVTALIPLAATDTVTFQFNNASGGNIDLNGASAQYQNGLTMQLLPP